MTRSIPLMWLCGPPGIGKTAVAWAVYRRLVAMGVPAAYVDVDQLGICYPEMPDDPGRHRLKARNVRTLRENFAGAGAACLIVSGVVDPSRGPAREVIGAPLLVGRLRAENQEHLDRLSGRRATRTDLDAIAREAQLLDRSRFADWCLDTSTMSIGEAAQQVLDTAIEPLLRGQRSLGADASPDERAEPAGGEALWVTGATGVGKSTIGFGVYRKVLSGGVRAAFVDVDQLGFFGEATDRSLRAENLASIWSNHYAAGADVMVVVGFIEEAADTRLYEQALPNVAFTWCRLHASPAELTRRVLSRRDGGTWPEPGDPLKGQQSEHLMGIAQRATSQAASLDANGIGIRLEVEDLPVGEAAKAVLKTTSWPRISPANGRS